MQQWPLEKVHLGLLALSLVGVEGGKEGRKQRGRDPHKSRSRDGGETITADYCVTAVWISGEEDDGEG